MAEDNGKARKLPDASDIEAALGNLQGVTKPSKRKPLPRIPDVDPTLVIPNLKIKYARGAGHYRISPKAVDRIVFGHMARGMEFLYGVIECGEVPIVLRQRAAEILVDTGTTMLKGRNINASQAVPLAQPDGPQFPVETPGEHAGSAAQDLDEEVPENWGEEPDPDAPPAEAPEPPPLPPPPDPVIHGDAQVRAKCEQRVLNRMARKGPGRFDEFKGSVMGIRFGDPPLMDLKTLLEHMIQKGTIAKKGAFYYSTARPPQPLPPFQVRT